MRSSAFQRAFCWPALFALVANKAESSNEDGDQGWDLLVHSAALFLVDCRALLLLDCVTHLGQNSVVWVFVIQLLLLENIKKIVTCSFTVSWTVRHCCSCTVLQTYRVHILLKLKEWIEQNSTYGQRRWWRIRNWPARSQCCTVVLGRCYTVARWQCCTVAHWPYRI